MNALFLHPNNNLCGNIFWPTKPSDSDLENILQAMEKAGALGYFVSLFPEGDGITFNKDDYLPQVGLADFRRCFDFIELHESLPHRVGHTLGALAKGACIKATCLVPVTNFELLQTFAIGKTIFHAPINGDSVQLRDHSWGMELCDMVDAETISNWVPEKQSAIVKDAALLGYALIEREILIPAQLLYEASDSVAAQERLLSYVIQDADLGLTLLRWAFCSYKKLEYLPNKAGWVGDFCYAYIIPSFGPKPKLCSAKPSVLRVENNWLGLEVDSNPNDYDISALANIIDDVITGQMANQVKSTLRTIGQAYYLIEPEASFLSLIYALDALCEVGDLRGPHQRAWIAGAVNCKAKKFGDLLSEYESLYEIRNRLVHDALTFSSMGEDPRSINQKIENILCLVILNIVRSESWSRSDFLDRILNELSHTESIAAINNWNPKEIKCPLQQLTDDKGFARVVAKRSTYRKD